MEKSYTETQHGKWLNRWVDSNDQTTRSDPDEKKAISTWLKKHLEEQPNLSRGEKRLPNHRLLCEEMASPHRVRDSYLDRLEAIVADLKAGKVKTSSSAVADPQLSSVSNQGEQTEATLQQQKYNPPEEKIHTSVDLSQEEWFKELLDKDSKSSRPQ